MLPCAACPSVLARSSAGAWSGATGGVMNLPEPDEPLLAGDHIAVAGPHEAIDRLQRQLSEADRG